MDSLRRADFDALGAIVAVRPPVNDVSIRGSARRDLVDRLAAGHVLLVAVRQFNGADLGAVAAGNAARRVHIAWLLAQRHGKVAGLTFNVNDVRVGQNVNVRVLVVFQVGRGDGRARAAVAVIGRAPAEYTVVLREHVAELGYPPAQAGSLLHQVDPQAGVRQVERSPHPADSPADDHHGVQGRATRVILAGDDHRLILAV